MAESGVEPRVLELGGGWRRRSLALAMVLAGLTLIWFTRQVGWGVGFMVWLPAALVILPAAACWERRRLVISGDQLQLEWGLWRRQRADLPVAEACLLVVPTAGLRSLVLRWPDGGEALLVSWLTLPTAEGLARDLDQALGRPLPRAEVLSHRLDV